MQKIFGISAPIAIAIAAGAYWYFTTQAAAAVPVPVVDPGAGDGGEDEDTGGNGGNGDGGEDGDGGGGGDDDGDGSSSSYDDANYRADWGALPPDFFGSPWGGGVSAILPAGAHIPGRLRNAPWSGRGGMLAGSPAASVRRRARSRMAIYGH